MQKKHFDVRVDIYKTSDHLQLSPEKKNKYFNCYFTIQRNVPCRDNNYLINISERQL